MNTFIRITALAAALILPLLAFLNCNKVTIASQWSEGTITIDGDPGDWQGPRSYNEKLDASFAIQNDSTTIYVLLVSANQALNRQLMMSGLVLWLDQDGGRARDIGFKYPIGLMERKAQARDLFIALNPPEEAVNEARVNYLLTFYFNDLQILDAENRNLGILSPAKARSESIFFALKYHEGQFVYELGLPLEHAGRAQWAIKKGVQFAIGLETPQFEFSTAGGRRPMPMALPDAATGNPGGSRGGGMRGGTRGGGMGPRMMGGRFGVQEPIKYWASVRLAEKQ